MVRQLTATRRRVGEILVELGIVSDDDISAALAEQRSSGQKLGDVLMAKRLVTQRDLLRALAIQFDQEFIDFDEIQLDLEVAAQISPALARRHRAMPIARKGDVVVVAMANPADVLAIDDLRNALGRQVHPVMADGQQIFSAIESLGFSDSRVQEAIQAAVGQSEASAPPESATPSVEVVEENSSPIVQFVDLLLSKAVQERASDVHVEPTAGDLRVRFRIDGLLQEAMKPPRSLQAGVISRIKVMADIDIAERRMAQDGRLTVTIGGQSHDVRVVTIPTVHGEAIVLRILSNDQDSLGLSELGFLPIQLDRYRASYTKPWGAILVTGPTGSGKSTTLYGTLRDLRSSTVNIMTVEDPVEYRLDGIKQVQVNPRAGMTFPTTLRSFLRADPDIVLVGEVRDGETAKIAIEASLTGHLVLSTLHTNNAASTPMRLIEMGVEPFLVTSALTSIVAQRLARRLCDRCKVGEILSSTQRVAAGVPDALAAADGSVEVFHPVGCGACSSTGYRGRFAVHEVMTMTDALRDLVLTRAPAAEIERIAVTEGMLTLRLDGMVKVAKGMTSLEELYRITT